MKDNSKKILLFLYSGNNEERWLTSSGIRVILPDLTDAGYKSLLFLLEKKQFLKVDKTTEEFRYSLSSYGKSFLEDKFPALLAKSDKEQEAWKIIIFLDSPKTDKNFRYLRSFLSKNKAISLTRGVFLYPGNLSELIKKELESSYRNAVVVMELGNWLIGDEFTIMGQKAGLDDLFSLYSGISKELESLIIILSEKNSANDGQKKQLFSVFNRFVEAVSADNTLLFYYFPQVETVLTLLQKLQKAFEI